MELAVLGLLIGGVVMYIARGHRQASATDADKLAVVQRMQGRHVVVRLDTGRLVLEQTGFLRPANGGVVLVGDDGKECIVPLGQLRGVEDANGVQGTW